MLIKTQSCHYVWYDENNPTAKPIGSFDMFVRKGGDKMHELWSFGIREAENRGKGYGQRMLSEALALADGYPIRLYVHKSNDVAIHIYQKAGFRIIGKFMGDEAWTMQKDGDLSNCFHEQKGKELH